MKAVDTDYDRFDMGMRVVCIKPYAKLKVGIHYSINGCGGLDSFGSGCRNKTGYGFSVKYEDYDWMTKVNDIEDYYFTYDEMSEYFITEDEDYTAYQRDKKIEQIIK